MPLTLKILLKYWEYRDYLMFNKKATALRDEIRDEWMDIFYDYLVPHNMRLSYTDEKHQKKKVPHLY